MDGKELITMVNNLPVIDYSRNHDTQIPMERCPTGAILWLDKGGEMIKGQEARKVVRKGERRMGST